MRKINIIDIFNPTKLRDWLNGLLKKVDEGTGETVTPGYGLSEKDGKIMLGREQDNITQVVDIDGEKELVLGRVVGSEQHGIITAKDYIILKEGDAKIVIISPIDTQNYEGLLPAASGEYLVIIDGASVVVTSSRQIYMGVGSGVIKPAFVIPSDNKPRVYIDDYNSDDPSAEYMIVNKKHLKSELDKLITRIEALEAKP